MPKRQHVSLKLATTGLVVLSRCRPEITHCLEHHRSIRKDYPGSRAAPDGGRVAGNRRYRRRSTTEGHRARSHRMSTTVVDNALRMRHKGGRQRDAARGVPRRHPKCFAILPARCEMTRPIRPANGGAISGSIPTPIRAGDGYIYDETPSRVGAPFHFLPMRFLARVPSRATKSAARRGLPGHSRFHRQQRRLLFPPRHQ
jgi:hypothetical protein